MYKWIGLVVITLAPGLAQAQQAKPDSKPEPQAKKDAALEDLLDKALKHNADVRVAEAKVLEAQAELSRARQQLVQKVTTLHAQIAAQKTVETEALGRRERARALHKQGGIAKEELDAMEAAWQKAKADLAVLEAQMRYLVGQP